MFKLKIIYRLIIVFLIFALMIIVPYSFTIMHQVDKMLIQKAEIPSSDSDEYTDFRESLTSNIIEQITPYVFYILILSLMFSIFFSRRILLSLKALQKGSQALKDGDLNTTLEILYDDELGEVTRAFNEMALSLKEKNLELQKKDIYVNAMLDPLWLADEYNIVVDINPAFTRLFGYSRDDVIGASIYDFFDEKNAAIMRRQLYEKKDKGHTSIYEINIFAKDGSQLPVLISGSPVYSDDEIVWKIGVLKDFREQSNLRNAVQQSKDYIETIMDSIQDELLVLDKDYRIVKTNKMVEIRAGSPVTGEFCHVVSHDKDHPCWEAGQECPVQEVFFTGKNQRAIHKHISASGEIIFHEIIASPIKDASGAVLNVIEVTRDVTEREKHEEDIFRKNKELTSLNSIAGILSRSLRPDEIFTTVLDKLLEMMNLDGGGIYFIDASNKNLECQYHRGISDDYVKLLGKIGLGEDIPGRVAVTGQVITSKDISKDFRTEKSIIKHSGIRGYCCMPIRGKERIIGVICLFSFVTHNFTMEEENILKSIGGMTGIAIENIRLYEKMLELYEYQRRRRQDEHQQLITLSTELGSAVELKDIMNNILELLKLYFRADLVWLLLNDNDGNLILNTATAFKEKKNNIIYRKGIDSIEGYSMNKGMTTVIKDIQSEDKYYIYPGIADLSFHSAIAVPMLVGVRPVGAYSFYYRGEKDLKEEEIHFLEIIANILAVAIQRSDFYIKAITEKGLSDTVLQSVTDGILTVDNSGRVISINRALEGIIAVSQTDAVGLSLCDLFEHKDKNFDFIFLFGECMHSALSGKSVSNESEMVTAFGNKITVRINSDPIFDSDAQVIGTVNILRDVSREKEIDRMKTDLIRSVSHEFRTPLSAIVGMTEMILEGDMDDVKSNKYLNTILDEGIRMSNMVSDLLDIARIESGKETLNFKVIQLRDLINAVKESFSSLIQKKRANVNSDFQGNENFVGDEEKIKQLFMNLFENALTFSDEGCNIKLKVSRSENDIKIVISDDGWGIPEEDIPYLTERFYRGKHGEKIKGTGLGLSLCNDIVKMHGGEMEIKSRLDEGTKIVLRIPEGKKDE